jgi:hypothetical protein
MLRSCIPGPFRFAIGLAVFSIRDEMRIIKHDGFLFLASEKLVTQTIHLALEAQLVFTNVAEFIIAAAKLQSKIARFAPSGAVFQI